MSQLKKPTAYDPATYWRAYYLTKNRDRSASGYVCYVIRGCPDNTGHCRAGWGKTERDALLSASYWGNQDPYIRVVPYSKAPAWVIEEII